MASAENIIENVRRIVRSEARTDVPVIQNAFLYEAINDGQNKWLDAFQQGGEDQISSLRETGYDLVTDTALAEDVATTDTAFDVDSGTDLASSGTILIWDDAMPDFVAYTSKSSNTLSGVTGIGFAHEDGDAVQKLYALPTNFGSFREAPNYGDGVMVEGVPYKYMSGLPSPGFFSMYDDGTSKYLILPRQLTGSASVLFNAAYTTIDSTDDTVGIPDRWKFFLIWHCVAYCYMGREDDANKMQFAQNKSEEILNRALRNRNTGKKIRPRSFGRISRDYVTKNGINIPLA